MMFLLYYFLEYNRYRSVLGIFVIIAIAVLFSKKRSHINVRQIVSALALQMTIAIAVLKTGIGEWVVTQVSDGVSAIYRFADEGSRFVFGSLADATSPVGFIFAVKVLPVIIFFGALTALMFHWGLLQGVIRGMNYLIRPLLGTSGAETLCAVANSFLGQTEAPLVIRRYLPKLTKSEMFVVMVSGMGTISGSILVVFAAMGVPAKHMLASSVMSIPVAIMIAKILYPETHQSETDGDLVLESDAKTHNALDAIAQGTFDGLSLAVNVAAMLISFLALLKLIDSGLIAASSWLVGAPWTLGTIFSYLFAPFGYLLGFDGNEILIAGKLLGTKVAVNELFAFSDMVNLHLSERMTSIMTYALCGFSNFSCIGIQVGGIGALVPEKRGWLTELGMYAVLGGALTNLMSAMVANIIL